MISAKNLKHSIYVFAIIVRLEDLDLGFILRGHHMVKVPKNITNISLVLEKSYPSNASTFINKCHKITST